MKNEAGAVVACARKAAGSSERTSKGSCIENTLGSMPACFGRKIGSLPTFDIWYSRSPCRYLGVDEVAPTKRFLAYRTLMRLLARNPFAPLYVQKAVC